VLENPNVFEVPNRESDNSLSIVKIAFKVESLGSVISLTDSDILYISFALNNSDSSFFVGFSSSSSSSSDDESRFIFLF